MPFPDQVEVFFSVKKRVEFGQSMTIVGETAELGNWKKGIKMLWSQDDVWRVCLTIK